MIMAYRRAAACAALLVFGSSQAQVTTPGPAKESAPEDLARDYLGGQHPDTDEMLARAKAAAKTGRERQSAHDTAAYSQGLREALGLTEDGTDAYGATTPDKHPIGTTTIAFVSSSVPLSTLRNYAAQLEAVGGHLIFRGVPGGMAELTPFIQYSMQILKHDLACDGAGCPLRNVGILIDPLLFRNLGITRVPAFSLVKSDIFQSYCQRQDETPSIAAVSYGDIHLSGHLEELERLGASEAEPLLRAFLNRGEQQ